MITLAAASFPTIGMPESTEPSGGGAVIGHDRDGNGIIRADFGWIAPVVGLLSVRRAAHGVVAGSRELPLAQLCGASWGNLRLI